VQEVAPGRGPSGVDLQNFTGNFESLPPYEGHPQGRVLYGTAPRRAPDPAFVRMIEAQGRQPAVTIDTPWLLVGNEKAARHIDGQITVLLRETWPSRGDLVRVPVPYAMISGHRGGPGDPIAYSPSVANGLSLTARHHAAPDPHGPKVDGPSCGGRGALRHEYPAGHLRGHAVVVRRSRAVRGRAAGSSEAVRVGSGAPGTQLQARRPSRVRTPHGSDVSGSAKE
jgi:hypothetical protein